MNERKLVLKALVGSHNYGLATPESDKDYKSFVLPTFDDLYDGKMYANQTITPTEDNDIHDVRKLIDLFYKSNVNFLEVLFSNEIKSSSSHIDKIISMKDEIVKINLPHLYNACGGMFLNKMKLLGKGTEGTQHLVDKFGYDTKQALHAIRTLDVIRRFALKDFSDFNYAITYKGQEIDFMIDVKNGFFKTQQDFERFANYYHDYHFQPLKRLYHSYKPNEELKEEIRSIIKDMVKENLLNG